MQSEDHRRTALQYPLFIGPYAAANNTALFSMKALARHQIILLGEQTGPSSAFEKWSGHVEPKGSRVGV